MKRQLNRKPISRFALSAVAWLSLWATAHTATAQGLYVHGQVTDSKSGEVLIGASVQAIGSKVRAVTDSQGRYSISTPDRKVRLKVSYLGYQNTIRDVTGTVADSVVCNILLESDDNTLEGITVIGKNEIRRLRDSGMPVSVISQQQLSGTTSNINDALAHTVGVTVRNTGGMGSASRLSVRGLEGKRMGMFVDDAPLGQMSNFVALNDIPTNMIERIEVYKGLVPYKFGGSALGGAVNVVTKEYPPVYFDVSYEVGSFNTHQLSTVLKRTDRKSGLQFGIGGVASYSDNSYRMRLDNLDGRTVRRDHDMFRKYMGGLSVKATKWWFDEIKLELIYMDTHQEMQGIDVDIREAYNFARSFVSTLKFDREDFFVEGIDFTLDMACSYGRYGLKDKAMQCYDWDGNSLPPVSSFGGEQGTLPADGDNKSLDLIGKLNLSYLIDGHHTVNLNVYAANTNMFPKDELKDKALGFRSNFHSRMSNATVGFSYDLTLFDGRFQNALTLKDFYYYSHSRSVDVYAIKEPEPVRVSKNYLGFSDALRYKLNRELMLKASLNSEVRIPTNEELIGNGYSILPSPALRPERTTGTNLGLLYRKEKNDGGLMELEFNAFYNTLKDMVRFSPDMIPTMARYRNFGTVRTMGIELEAKGDVHPMLYLYANGTYQDLRDVRKMVPGTNVENPTHGKRIPNVPYLLANFGAEFHRENLFGGRYQNTRVFFDASYIHQYYYDFEMSAYQDRRIPTSLTMDAAVEHSFLNDRLTFTLKAKNLADRRVISELNCPLPGRSFAFKVRYLIM